MTDKKTPRTRLRTLDQNSLRQVAGGDPKPPVIKLQSEDDGVTLPIPK